MKKEELLVAAIENGTVIDHIPSNKLFEVINLLQLQKLHTAIMIGFNIKSKKMGEKSIIKIADKFFTHAELNQLSVVAPNVSLCTIKNYEVVEKKQVNLPDDLIGIVKCNNPKCVTNNEPVPTHFHVIDKNIGKLQCHYCEKEQNIDQVKLV